MGNYAIYDIYSICFISMRVCACNTVPHSRVEFELGL